VLPLAVAHHLAAHHGVAARSDLVRLGLTQKQINRLVRRGLLELVQPGVYRLVAVADTMEQRAAGACAVAPEVVISHATAARLLGLHVPGPRFDVHVTTDGVTNRVLRGVVLHRSFRMEPIDVIDRADGIRLTSPPRIAFDMSWTLSDFDLTALIEEIFRLKFCTYPTLLATGRRLAERGRKGSAGFTRVLSSRPAWRKPPGSKLELRVERAFIAAGLPRPERNVAIKLVSGDIIHPDFFWRPELVACEIDHVTWHGGGLDAKYDKWRDRQLARLGILTVRITDEHIDHALPEAIADLGAILHSRTQAA
jgi:Transcriptional regulator, AbiEi antitoxin